MKIKLMVVRSRDQRCSNCTHYEAGHCNYYERDMSPNERCTNHSSK